MKPLIRIPCRQEPMEGDDGKMIVSPRSNLMIKLGAKDYSSETLKINPWK